MNPIRIGNSRELFWDDYLINTSLTGTRLKLHHLRREEVCLMLDMPWEGDGCIFFSMVEDGGTYRMYYMGTDCRYTNVRVCVVESEDGIHWRRPALNLRPFPGYETTNILLDNTDERFDNFHAFLDENPTCPPEERYKATASGGTWDGNSALWCWTSPDGYRWKKSWIMTRTGYFDTQNVAFWSKESGKYFCYIRDFHNVPGNDLNAGIRDIRVMTSHDFKTWSEPVLVDFGSRDDIPLYTNAVYRYPRAPQMLVGMPTRYVERKEWTGNYDQLADPDLRKQRMEDYSIRAGLAVTDCVLMTSRDGIHWNRFDEAWYTAGIERPYSWVYGDGYPAVGTIATPSALPGAPDELSYYIFEGHISGQPEPLRRYTIRADGLISMRADYAPQKLVTKPLLYEGGQLHLNFSTSARGYIYVTAKCGQEKLYSCELFGDTLDRTVPFDGDLEAFKGKEVTLEFTMSDADLYAMQFV